MSGANWTLFLPVTATTSDNIVPNGSLQANSSFITFPAGLEWNPWITVEMIYLTIICLAGSIGNILVIAAVVLQTSLRTTPNIFIVILAIIDLINTAILIPFFILSLHNLAWPYHPGSCKFLAYLTILCLGMSVVTLGLIAGYRYVNIARTKQTYLNRCSSANVVAVFCICLIIVIPAVLIPPNFGFGSVGFNKQIRHCSLVYEDYQDWLYPFCLFICCVFVVAAVIPTFYFLTFCAVYKSNRKVRMSNFTAFQIENSAQGKSKIQTLQRPFSREEFRLTTKLVLIFTVFLVCWMPYGITVLLDSDRNIPSEVHRVTNLGVWTGSCINPYLYAWMIKSFRITYKRIFCGCDPQCTTSCCCRSKSRSVRDGPQKVSSISKSLTFAYCVSATSEINLQATETS